MRPATLGTIGMVASPALLVSGLVDGFDQQATTPAAALLRLVFLIGWAASVVGLRQLRAAGDAGRVTLAIQLAGIALAATQELQDLGPSPDRTALVYRAADAAWPLSVLFMIVNGVLTARARVLPGWRRLTPIVCGLALPAAIVFALVAGQQAMQYSFPVFTTVAWHLLGHAVRAADARGAGGP